MIDRVRFVAVSGELGGGEIHLLRTAAATARYADVAVAGLAGTPTLAEAHRLGMPVIELALGNKLSRRSAARNLLRYPDARRRLHAFIAEADAGDWTVLQYKWEQLLWAGRVRPERVALWEHGPIPRPLLRVPWWRAELRRAFRDASTVFAWSIPARDGVVALAGRRADLLRAGVEPGRIQAALAQRDEIRERLARTGPLHAFAGRLIADKGIAELVRALPGIPGATALVCGAGPQRAQLEQLAAKLGVSERTRFLGFVDDPLPYLAAADVAVLLSRSPGEGRPLAVVEAAAVGTPVLGLVGSPALEALAAEGLVRLVSSAEPDTLRQAVEALRGVRRTPAETPTWEQTAERFLDVLGRSVR